MQQPSGLRTVQVVAEKQIEPPVGATAVLDRSSYLVDDLQPGIRVVNRRDEGQIPFVGGLHHPAHIPQAVEQIVAAV